MQKLARVEGGVGRTLGIQKILFYESSMAPWELGRKNTIWTVAPARLLFDVRLPSARTAGRKHNTKHGAVIARITIYYEKVLK